MSPTCMLQEQTGSHLRLHAIAAREMVGHAILLACGANIIASTEVEAAAALVPAADDEAEGCVSKGRPSI